MRLLTSSQSRPKIARLTTRYTPATSASATHGRRLSKPRNLSIMSLTGPIVVHEYHKQHRLKSDGGHWIETIENAVTAHLAENHEGRNHVDDVTRHRNQ